MRRVALAVVSTVAGLVVLLSFKTSSPAGTPPAAIGTPSAGNLGTSGPAETSAAPRAKRSSVRATSTTVTGTAANTQFGPVQVQLTVRSGKIIKVVAVEYPTGSPQDSEISRMRRGELRLLDADPDVHRVLAHCADAQLTTGGRFTGMPGGRLDPTGLVKGWAVEQASGKLCGHGADNHAVNGGGDVQLAGEAAPGRPW